MARNQISKVAGAVKMSNALARARWDVKSVWEPRLVALLASKVRADDTDFFVYEIHVSELLQGAHSGRDYKEIESIIDKVMSRVLTIHDENGWTKYNIFSRCRFRRSEGILELGFHPDLRPHYLNLQQYMKYSLSEFISLPSIYSQKMYEYLKSWNDKSEIIISLSELNDMLNTPDASRKNFAEFKRRVLEKAHKDITSLTSLNFQWEAIKKGRSVTAIRFIFIQKCNSKNIQESNLIYRPPVEIPQKNISYLENHQEKSVSDTVLAIASKSTVAAGVARKCRADKGSACNGGHQHASICGVCRLERDAGLSSEMPLN